MNTYLVFADHYGFGMCSPDNFGQFSRSLYRRARVVGTFIAVDWDEAKTWFNAMNEERWFCEERK